MSTGIVTDSTCDIEPQQLASLGVEVVPLKVMFGTETYLDWVEMEPDEFYRRLATSPTLPKTSQPSPAKFTEVYERLAASGATEIVSIHLSSALSGTFESASIAAAQCSVPVHVVDSKTVSQATGLVVRAAVEARARGSDGAAIAEHARSVATRMNTLFVLDSLDYLVKGGRAGKAQGLAAALLNIKPVLRINADGIIEPFKKVKGRKRAIAEIALAIADLAASAGRVRVAVLHGCLEDCGDELINAIQETGADVEIAAVGLVGSVIGTYAGPRAIGAGFYVP